MKDKLFLFVYAIANGGLVAYGLMAAVAPNTLLEPFSQHVYEFPADAFKAVAYLGALFRLLGYFNLIAGALGLILLSRWRRGREVWILRTLIPLTALSYLGPVVFDNTVGTIGLFEIIEHVLLLMVIAAGIVMLAGLRRVGSLERR